MRGKASIRPPEAARHFGGCQECGKVRYGTKRVAKLAARQLHPSQNLRAYRCGDYWHCGSAAVAKKSREQFLGARLYLVIVDECTRMPWETS